MLRDKTGRELSTKEAGSKVVTRLYNYLLDFELMVLRWVGHVPFHTIRKLFYILAGVRLGKGSTIHMWANFFEPGGVVIGEDTIIGDHAFLVLALSIFLAFLFKSKLENQLLRVDFGT